MVKRLFSNKGIGILGVIFIAPYKSVLHLNFESYFFILYHKKRYNRQRNCSGKGDQKGLKKVKVFFWGQAKSLATEKTLIKKNIRGYVQRATGLNDLTNVIQMVKPGTLLMY